MTRIIIFLNELEHDALLKLAEKEYRDPRSQAARIIRTELEQLGLIDKKEKDEKDCGNAKQN